MLRNNASTQTYFAEPGHSFPVTSLSDWVEEANEHTTESATSLGLPHISNDAANLVKGVGAALEHLRAAGALHPQPDDANPWRRCCIELARAIQRARHELTSVLQLSIPVKGVESVSGPSLGLFRKPAVTPRPKQQHRSASPAAPLVTVPRPIFAPLAETVDFGRSPLEEVALADDGSEFRSARKQGKTHGELMDDNDAEYEEISPVDDPPNLYLSEVIDQNMISKYLRHRLGVLIDSTFQSLERTTDHLLGKMTSSLPVRFRMGFGPLPLVAPEENTLRKEKPVTPKKSPPRPAHAEEDEKKEPLSTPASNIDRYRHVANQQSVRQQAKLLALSTGGSASSVFKTSGAIDFDDPLAGLTPGVPGSLLSTDHSASARLNPQQFRSRRARQYAEQYRHLLSQHSGAMGGSVDRF